MKTMRIGVIGAWGHLGAVLEQIEMMPGVEISGLAGVFPEDAYGQIQQTYSKAAQAKVHGTYQEMLRLNRPDIVVIGTRLDQISVAACAAAEAGCHLICEKPLAIELSALADLWAAVQAHSVECITMLANGDRPAIRTAAEIVRKGVLGSVAVVNVRKSYRWGERPAWFGRRDLYGGTIPWIGIHALDMLWQVTGKEVLRVAAWQGNMAHPELPQCQDHAAMLLELVDGGMATITVDFLRPAGAPTHGDDWIRVVGSCGQIEAYLDRGPGGVCHAMVGSEAGKDEELLEEGHVFQGFIEAISVGKAAGLRADTARAFRTTYLSLQSRAAAEERGIRQIDDRYSPAWVKRTSKPISR
nr:GFO/IDH/MocA family oxidoreductase [uncultured bacterium]